MEMHEMDEGRHDKERRLGGGLCMYLCVRDGVKAHPRSLHQQSDRSLHIVSVTTEAPLKFWDQRVGLQLLHRIKLSSALV